jgi:hypothetical protein
MPENVAQDTENQIENQSKINSDPPAGTEPRASQNIEKQSAPMADATHMLIIEEVSRR